MPSSQLPWARASSASPRRTPRTTTWRGEGGVARSAGGPRRRVPVWLRVPTADLSPTAGLQEPPRGGNGAAHPDAGRLGAVAARLPERRRGAGGARAGAL